MFPTLPRVLLSRRPNSPLLRALVAAWAWCHRALQLAGQPGREDRSPWSVSLDVGRGGLPSPRARLLGLPAPTASLHVREIHVSGLVFM